MKWMLYFPWNLAWIWPCSVKFSVKLHVFWRDRLREISYFSPWKPRMPESPPNLYSLHWYAVIVTMLFYAQILVVSRDVVHEFVHVLSFRTFVVHLRDTLSHAKQIDTFRDDELIFSPFSFISWNDLKWLTLNVSDPWLSPVPAA